MAIRSLTEQEFQQKYQGRTGFQLPDDFVTPVASPATTTETPSSSTDFQPPKQRGMLWSFAKEMYKGAVRPLATPFAGVYSGITGKDVELPEWLGSAKASVDLDKQSRIAGGAAFEAATLIPAGKGLAALRTATKGKPLAGATLKTLMKEEAKYGFKTGAAGSAGYTLGQQPDANAEDVVESALYGGLIGAGVGFVSPLIAKGYQLVRNKWTGEASNAVNRAKIGKVPPAGEGVPSPPDGSAPSLGSLADIDEDLFPPQNASAKPLDPKLRQKALDYGIKEVQMANIEQASANERAMMREMLDIGEEKIKNPLYSKDPTEVAARPVMEQITHLKKTRKSAGAALDDAVSKMPDQPIAITEQRNGLLGWFEREGIRVGDDGILDFAESQYRTSASAADRAILQELADELRPQKSIQKIEWKKFAKGKMGQYMKEEGGHGAAMTRLSKEYKELSHPRFDQSIDIYRKPKEIRTLRQALRRIVEDKARSGQPLSSPIEDLIDALRRDLNLPLAAISDEYAKANFKFAVTSDALTNFYKFLGKRFYDTTDELTGMRVQEILARLMGNAPANVSQTLGELQGAASKTGFKGIPDVDIRRLLYADELISDVFELTAPRGLQGGVERGTAAALETAGMMKDVATQNYWGAITRVMNKWTKITPKKRQELLKELLAETREPPVYPISEGIPPVKPQGGQEAMGAMAGMEPEKNDFMVKSQTPELQVSIKNVIGTKKIKDITAFERAKGLSSENKIIEDKAFEKIIKKEDEILADYKNKEGTMGGKIVNADSFRPYFVDEGYAGYNAAAVQEPASYLGKRAFTEALKNPGEDAILYAGGSGTGKTSAIKNSSELKGIIDKAAVILDGNLSSLSSARLKILEATKAGKKTPIMYVYRDPIESFREGIVKRMKDNPEEMGRLVPNRVTAGNHIDSWDVVRTLYNEGHNVYAIDNTYGKGGAKLATMDKMEQKISYPSKEKLTELLNAEAKKLLDEKEITLEQYKGYVE